MALNKSITFLSAVVALTTGSWDVRAAAIGSRQPASHEASKATSSAQDDSFKILHEFNDAPEGRKPRALIEGSDGDFYGVAEGNGYGVATVFRATRDGGLSVLAVLDRGVPYDKNACDTWRECIVQAADGALYVGHRSSVYRVAKDGDVKAVHRFDHNGRGSGVYGLVLGLDHDLYVTTNRGVFRMAPDGAAVTECNLCEDSNIDVDLYGGIVKDKDGRFYAMAGKSLVYMGLTGSCRILKTSENLRGDFSEASITVDPGGGVVGTTYGDDPASKSSPTRLGTIFRVTPDGVVKELYSVRGDEDKEHPGTGVVAGRDGNLYGTTSTGRDGARGVYRLTPGGILTVIHAFSAEEASRRPDIRFAGSDGNLYGIMPGARDNDNGALFRVTPDGILTILHAFVGGDGIGPTSLLPGPNGSLYGVTPSGGLKGGGAIFNMTPDGALSTVYAFKAPKRIVHGSPDDDDFSITYDAFNPSFGIILGADGNLYGGESDPGSTNGLVYKVTPGGDFTSLHAIPDDFGGRENGRVVEGLDGNLYGVTMGKGAYNNGSIYRITPDGNLTTLYSFTGKDDGAFPDYQLTLGLDGNLYGTTSSGPGPGSGPANPTGGVAFRLSTTGDFKALYAFADVLAPYRNGPRTIPFCGMSEGGNLTAFGANGDLYGVTNGQEPWKSAMLYRITPSGGVTVLHTFTEAEDCGLCMSLTVGEDGTLYGGATESQKDGIYVNAVLYSVTPSSQFRVLRRITGEYPFMTSIESLIVGADKCLYGTLWHSREDGKIFKLTLDR